jgi:Flavin containing amine oxidoreductase
LLGPITGNVWYAGEAAHETLWGTVGGAWESGERAADAALRAVGGLRPATPVASDTDTDVQDKRKTKRAKAERGAPRYGETTPQYRGSGGTPNIMGTER